MLLHIFRLEAKASPKRPAIEASGRKSRERRTGRVRGYNLAGRPPLAERTPFMPRTVLLRLEVSPADETNSALAGGVLEWF